MAEQVVWASMRDVSEAADDDVKVADVTALFNTHVNDGRVILIVEGPDDREVYEKVTDSAATCIYADCSCEKHFVILKALNGRYGKRLLAIKDADFDRLEGIRHSYSNLLLTDNHDMEGMIVGACLTNLQGEDAERCQSISLDEIYSELEDISYLKWFSHWKHCGINFSDTILDLDIEMYFNACVANTNNDINVTLPDVYAFKAAYKDVEKKELCNGHDILERIYVRAKAARVSNFAKKSFFRRLRGAYSKELFVNTLFYKDIKEFESASGCTVLAD